MPAWSAAATLSRAQPATDVEVALVRGSSLRRFQVTTETGAPIAGAAVAVVGEGEDRQTWSLASDAQGRFSARGLSAGLYTVRVHATDYLPSETTYVVDGEEELTDERIALTAVGDGPLQRVQGCC